MKLLTGMRFIQVQDEVKSIRESLGIEIGDDEYAANLERLMEVLFSAQFILKKE